MRLEASIAWRYLCKKKSHGAVSVIAIVSVVGVAVATAALVCVLSVFNGFRMLLVDRSDLILPDIEVTAVNGKLISEADSLTALIKDVKGVEVASPILADQALAIFSQKEMPVMLRGVEPQAFRHYTHIDSLIVSGITLPSNAMEYEPPAGLISVGVASRLQAFNPGECLFLFAPKREGRINLANPAASFFTDSITTVGIFESLQNEYDAATIYVDIEMARELLQYGSDATSIVVKGNADVDLSSLSDAIAGVVGKHFVVRDRLHQQELNFRMVQIEKWVTGLLLLFILVIASFNIISTMTMFVLEKRRQMRTLRSIGMAGASIGEIFGWESLYITFIGALSGIVSGIGLCLLQEHFGLIKMQGNAENMLLQAYPVKLIWSDLWMVTIPVVLIGLLTAWIASAFARSRISEKHQ